MNVELEVRKKFQFDKLYNFRDIGGLKTVDGKMMKPGILYRSDDLSRLTQKDMAKLQEYNLRLICDLRTVNERKSKSYDIPQGWDLRVVQVPIHHGSQDFTRFQFFRFLVGKSNDIDFEKIIRDFYHCMATERTAEIKEVFTFVAQTGHVPALIHCTGGKDRTGFIAALIQLSVGVPRETVIEQYVMSNDLIKPRMKKIERFIRFMSLWQVSPERIKPMLVVRREYLEDVLDYILEQYGSIENYLVGTCGIEEKTIKDLRNMLVE